MSSNKIHESIQPEVPVIPNVSESIICEQYLSSEVETIQPHLWFDENGVATEAGIKEFGYPSKEPQEAPKVIISYNEKYPALARAREEAAILRRAAMADLGLVVMNETEIRWNGHTTQPDIET